MSVKSRKTKDDPLAPDLSWVGHLAWRESLAPLARLCERGVLPQVLLLTGREGIGKRSLSLALAALFFCERASACGECCQCRALLRPEHRDILILGGEDLLKVEAAEQLQEHLTIKTSRTSDTPRARRLALVFDAERLTVQAVNRLLKTLEEPPPDCHIFLTTSRPRHLLPTLLSRCVRWQLKPPALSQTVAFLMERQKVEKDWAELSQPTLEALVERQSLSPGRTLTYLSERAVDARDLSEALKCLIESGRIDDMLGEAEALGRGAGCSAAVLAREAEYALNVWYKSFMQRRDACDERALSPLMLKRRRNLLGQLKLLAGKQKITLNAQLAAERLGVSSREDSW